MVSLFTNIITVNASRSKVTEGALAPSNHSLCICKDQELLLSSARLSHFKLRRCLCILIDLFCLLSPALLFSLVDCCYRWMEGKQADMCALFVMHKQEVARLGELGTEGGGEGGSLYQSASSSTQACKWGSGYQSHSPASLSEWS